jgi:methyltransferase-like protein/SAM-dependent methyltransferase
VTVNLYDEFVYPGHSIPQSHPDNLATLATLFGMTPAPVDHCRVLEIGCGDGGNLIPMAFALPDSRFVGFDLAARPIATGSARANVLGLKNIELHALDIMDVPADFGTFDYILCHGVYSWVPDAVKVKLLEICRQHLAPAGVAYVSYDTHPGGHLRGMLREMMLYHVREISDPAEKARQARALVKFLSEAKGSSDSYGSYLREEWAGFTDRTDSDILHDELERNYSPIWFHQFMAHAREHGLQYLADAMFHTMNPRDLPAEAARVVREVAQRDNVIGEQYLDFLTCRFFRRTLLCHQDVPLDRALPPEKARAFYVASSAKTTAQGEDLRSDAVVEFKGGKGVGLTTSHPLAKTALALLGRIWPRALHFEQLLLRTRAALELPPSQDEAEQTREALKLGDVLLRTYAGGLVEFHVHPARFASQPGPRPMVSALVRLQAAEGDTITTPSHATVHLADDLVREILKLLDGTRDLATVVGEIVARIESGEIPLQQNGAPLHNRESVWRAVTEKVDLTLAESAQWGLFLA